MYVAEDIKVTNVIRYMAINQPSIAVIFIGTPNRRRHMVMLFERKLGSEFPRDIPVLGHVEDNQDFIYISILLGFMVNFIIFGTLFLHIFLLVIIHSFGEKMNEFEQVLNHLKLFWSS